MGYAPAIDYDPRYLQQIQDQYAFNQDPYARDVLKYGMGNTDYDRYANKLRTGYNRSLSRNGSMSGQTWMMDRAYSPVRDHINRSMHGSRVSRGKDRVVGTSLTDYNYASPQADKLTAYSGRYYDGVSTGCFNREGQEVKCKDKSNRRGARMGTHEFSQYGMGNRNSGNSRVKKIGEFTVG